MEKEDVEKLKKLALEEHQFYNRRYEQVTLIVSGFGLYACLEYSKILITAKQLLSPYLFIAVIFFTASIILSLSVLLLEKKIRGYYLQLFFEEEVKKEKAKNKSFTLENWTIILDITTLVTILIGIVFLITAVSSFIY